MSDARARIKMAMQKWLHANDAEPGDRAGSPMETLDVAMETAENDLRALLAYPALALWALIEDPRGTKAVFVA